MLPCFFFSHWGDKQWKPHGCSSHLQRTVNEACTTWTVSNPLMKNTQLRKFLFVKHHPEAVSLLSDMQRNAHHGLETPYLDSWRNHEKTVIMLELLLWRDWPDKRIKAWKLRFYFLTSYDSICKTGLPTTVTT